MMLKTNYINGVFVINSVGVMVDFDRMITRFRQFGGWRLVYQYVRMGVLWTGGWRIA